LGFSKTNPIAGTSSIDARSIGRSPEPCTEFRGEVGSADSPLFLVISTRFTDEIAGRGVRNSRYVPHTRSG
jgi:hypothetical protein